MQGFIKMSRYAGMREDLVQAGGGNSSYKISPERMLIKASGYQLADITEEEGYAIVNPQIIKSAFLDDEVLSNMSDELGKKILQEAFIEGKRPSIETFLHAISGKYTLHTHPIVVNALTCRKSGMETLKELFPQALIVPYATPGAELAKQYFVAYKNSISDKDNFDIVFLQNHGLVVSADSADEAIQKTEQIILCIEKHLECDFGVYRGVTDIWKWFPNKVVWRVTDQNVLSYYENMKGMWKHAFCPDCIVFLGKKALQMDETTGKAAIGNFIEKNADPVIIMYNDTLYILGDSVKKAFEIQSVLSFSAQVMRLNKDHECNFLPDKEQNLLLNWDAEKYRKNMK